jgi:hypothetical protein
MWSIFRPGWRRTEFQIFTSTHAQPGIPGPGNRPIRQSRCLNEPFVSRANQPLDLSADCVPVRCLLRITNGDVR